MASTILAVSATPSTFASGSFPIATLNGGPAYAFTWTPAAASTASEFSGFECYLATNDDGGLYINARRIELYNGTSGGTLVAQSAVLTWSAGQPIRIVVNLAAGANASSMVISGATSGNGTTTFTTSGTYFTASVLGVGQFTNAATFKISGTISSLDDNAPAGATGSASVGGVTSTGAARPTTFASGAAAVAGTASSGAATVPGTATGTSAVGGISSSGSAASPALASGSASVGGVTSSGSAGTPSPSLFGTIGQSTAGQRADQTGAVTGTMSTLFATRTPSAAVAVNDRLIFNDRRWHVSAAGTLGSGSGPTGTGAQTDGTATLVALSSTDTALSMTTQSSTSVMVACLMRDQWASDTSAPTDNKGNTYAIQGTSHAYAGFASASSAVYAAVNASGGSGHVVSATWPQHSATGAEMSLLVVEVPTSKATSFVQATSFVERTTASSVTSASVTTTGPAMLIAFWLGTGNVMPSVGQTHPGAPSAPFTQLLNADTAVDIHNNGYIQAKTGWAYVTDPGTYTATWTGTSEGAQLYLVAIQEQAGTSASGSANVGGVTGSGSTSTSTTTIASGSSAVAGISSSGSAQPTTLATGAASVGGVSSAGTATPTTSASGSAAVAGISSTGAATSSAGATGATAVGGIASSGSTAVIATGAAAVGGIGGDGAVAVALVAQGGAAVGGVSSSGTTASSGPSSASGASSVAGIASAGATSTSTYAGGAAAVGGVASFGAAGGPSAAFGTATIGGITSAGAANAESRASGAASVAGISSTGAATSSNGSDPEPGHVRIAGVSPDPEVYSGPIPGAEIL